MLVSFGFLVLSRSYRFPLGISATSEFRGHPTSRVFCALQPLACPGALGGVCDEISAMGSLAGISHGCAGRPCFYLSIPTPSRRRSISTQLCGHAPSASCNLNRVQQPDPVSRPTSVRTCTFLYIEFKHVSMFHIIQMYLKKYYLGGSMRFRAAAWQCVLTAAA